MARGGDGQPARFAEELPASTGTFKFKDFMKLINSVSSKKGLFLFGILLSLVTSGASLVVPQLTKGLVDTSELSKIDGKMVADAIKMKELVSGNTYVKIPASPEEITAISMLTEEGIKTSASAIYSFNQALLAAQAGADYVAVYVSRLDKLGASGIEVVRKIKRVFVEKGMESKVSAASLKTPESVEEAIMAGADNVAVTLDMLDQLAVHPLTQQTLDTFKEDWEGLFGEGVRIVHMEG